MRTTFIQELVKRAETNPRIFLIVGDVGYSVVEAFAERFPDRFLNAGIAEQNMTGVAAGLASEGFHVFTYSIANFPILRCLEQIRNDICYHNLPVTVVSVGGGLSYGSLGYSHHAVQDYTVLRCLPGMTIASPGDPSETRSCIEWITENAVPSYLRLGKSGEPVFRHDSAYLKPGKILLFGNEISKPAGLVLTTGAALRYAVEAVKNTRWNLATLPIWSIESSETLAQQLKKYSTIVTVEDHLEEGGFGSYIREVLGRVKNINVKISCIALDPSVCGMVAVQDKLNEYGGLTSERIRSFITT